MELCRIVTPEDERMQKLVALYLEAFPASERREPGQLKYLTAYCPQMYFNAVEEAGELAGLFIYWKLDSFYFLEHLAVYPEMRNRKIGQQVLDYIQKNLPGERLLEVELPADELTTRRVNYYRRNGYEVVDKNYRQPPYDAPGEGYPLWIMSNAPEQSPGILEKHIQTVKEEVYFKYYRL